MQFNETSKSVTQTIFDTHKDDSSQLAVIQSEEDRLLVEAPAGYGKTATLVSRLAYMLANGNIQNYTRVLALTFSVNAAYKIKKDVITQLPLLLDKQRKEDIKRMFVSNYHGFSRYLLSKYGYLLNSNLKQINSFNTFDDSSIENLMTQFKIEQSEAFFISDFNDKIKKSDVQYIENNIEKYNAFVIKKFVQNNCIPYNGILSLVIKLLREFPNVQNFYSKYFSTVIIDEFQDTNYLSYTVVKSLIGSSTKLFFLGDSLQRIYGFIGAVPGLMDKAVNEFDLTRMELKTNHRFKDNAEMLVLDKNIRENARDPYNPNIQKDAHINHQLLNNQEEEANFILDTIGHSQKHDPTASITILVKQRNRNTQAIVSTLETRETPFFNGLFSDEDSEYIDFCKDCLIEFNVGLSKGKSFRNALSYMSQQVERNFSKSKKPLYISFNRLLKVFCAYIQREYRFLSPEEKIDLVRETLDHNGLKQYMQYLDSKISITTVHGAKGLEWDYVIIPDMEAYNFPNYYGLCGNCSPNSKKMCELELQPSIEDKYLEELSVFYVAVTRARKDVFFTSSREQINFSGQNVRRNISCFLKLSGVFLKNINQLS